VVSFVAPASRPGSSRRLVVSVGGMPAEKVPGWPLVRAERPARVDSRWAADVWFEPTLVVEVLAAELTLSPHHTAGWGILKEYAGRRCGSPASPDAGATTRPLGRVSWIVSGLVGSGP
jgi:hypothetical protein